MIHDAVLCKKTDKAEIFALLKDHIDEALMELPAA